MSEVDPSNASQIPSSYKPEDITSLLLFSFYYSRGMQNFQASMLTRIGVEYGDRFDSSVLDKALKPAIETAYNIYTNPAVHVQFQEDRTEKVKRRKVKSEMTGAFGILKAATEGQAETPTDSRALGTRMLSTDEEWMPLILPHRAATRPRYSQWLAHGILGRPTGRPEFDEVFTSVGQTIASEPELAWWNPDDPIRPGGESGLAVARQVLKGHLKERPDDLEKLEDKLAGTDFEPTLKIVRAAQGG